MGRVRGRQRRALRGPFLLAMLAAIVGFFGFSSLSTPVSSIVLFPTATPTITPTPTATFTPTSTNTPTSTATSTSTNTPTVTFTPTVTDTPTITSTSTRTPRPTRTPTNTPPPIVHQMRVPILMYHHVGDLPPDADAVRTSLTVSQARFEEQMNFLKDQGYITLHIADLVHALQTGEPLPDKAIILTFDDGYDDNYTNVFPTLKDHGFVGTFFVIGSPTDYGSPGYLRWEQILEMYNNGMEIGAHSLTHRYNLGMMRQSTQDGEILPDHKLMVDHLPNWTPIFSYPSGSYNQYTLDLLNRLGYIAAVTTNQGTLQSSDAAFELRRIRIRGEWTAPQFLYWFNYWTSRP